MRKTFMCVLISSATALLAATACDSATAPEDITGAYALTAVNSSAVPFVVGPLGRAFADTTIANQDCLQVISKGALTLTSYQQTFTLDYSSTNSCSPNGTLGTNNATGTYKIRGNVIDFRMFGDANESTFSGTISRRRIDVADSPFTLSFTRK